MQRNILIIDDHDDLTTDLKRVFTETGNVVTTAESCAEALSLGDLSQFDIVISDLDSDQDFYPTTDADRENLRRLPKFPQSEGESRIVKNFKIWAMDFRRENFDEAELKNLVETALNYKAQHIDNDKKVLEMHERIEFEFPSALSLMHAVLDYLVGRMARMGVVNPDKSNIYIALDEAFVNAVKHGNKFDVEKSVKISADITPEEARFVVEDEGAGFDVKAIPDPLDPENLFKTSGRGVLMIHNIMDEVSYNEKGNRLEMLKKTEKH